MYKVFALCIAVTLLLSASAFSTGNTQTGNIGQTEKFTIYAINPASVVGGQGTASGSNLVSAEQAQNIKKLFTTMFGQSQTGMLSQDSDISGRCGSFDFTQKGSAVGSQSQLLSKIGFKDMVTQSQAIVSGLEQTASKNGGIGSAGGTQSTLTEQIQSFIGKGTMMNSSQSIGASQTATVSGSLWSDATASNLILVTGNQSQTSP